MKCCSRKILTLITKRKLKFKDKIITSGKKWRTAIPRNAVGQDGTRKQRTTSVNDARLARLK